MPEGVAQKSLATVLYRLFSKETYSTDSSITYSVCINRFISITIYFLKHFIEVPEPGQKSERSHCHLATTW